MSDKGQICEESIAPMGFELKPSYVLEDDPTQVGVGIPENSILALSTQEQLDVRMDVHQAILVECANGCSPSILVECASIVLSNILVECANGCSPSNFV